MTGLKTQLEDAYNPSSLFYVGEVSEVKYLIAIGPWRIYYILFSRVVRLNHNTFGNIDSDVNIIKSLSEFSKVDEEAQLLTRNTLDYSIL